MIYIICMTLAFWGVFGMCALSGHWLIGIPLGLVAVALEFCAFLWLDEDCEFAGKKEK